MMEREEQTEKNGEKTTEEVTEENFLKELYFFMKQRETPIERIPHLGFKQIDLYLMYKTVKDLGGYHQVTAQQLWKKVYNILGGNPRSTSAATCTRRHYEKLLLPYECHLAGYTADIPITHPRSASKRIRTDDDYILGSKHPDLRHLPSSIQREFQMNPGGIRFFPMPISHYIHPGSPSIPGYFPIPYKSVPTIPDMSPLAYKQPLMSHPPTSSSERDDSKKSLEYLRHLAEEYKSSSGWAEPLNLSKKQGKLETSSDTPSSFAPPSTKKFLNKVHSLYQPRGVGTNEGGDQQGESVRPSKWANGPSPTNQAAVNPINVDETQVMPLSSSSRKSPTNTSSYPSAGPEQLPEQKLHVPWAKPSDTPQSSPGSLSPDHTPGRPLPDPYGGMEIQIPLSVLQKWVKEGLLVGSAPGHQRLAGPGTQESKHPPSPMANAWRSHSSESTANQPFDHPADLSLKTRGGTNSGKHDHIVDTYKPFTNQLMAREGQLPPSSRYASVRPYQLSAPLKADSKEFYRPKTAEASTKQTHPPTKMARDGTDHKSPGFRQADVGLGVAVRQEKAPERLREVNLPTANANSTSPSLIHITPEHLKLLLANAQFRLERGKIC